MNDGPVSREEFEMLVQRVETIDQRGSYPGVSALARLDALTEAVEALRGDIAANRDRAAANRRWLVAAIFSGAAAIAAVVSVLAGVFHIH
jgi:hypothetical protein